MSANTRKPVCPGCHGAGGWNATYLDPSEVCLACHGAGHVSKRKAARLLRRANADIGWYADLTPRAPVTDINDITF